MKRYKLLKDLPMFDAGEEGFYLDSDGNLMHHALSSGETVYPAPTLARHPEILRDWFEEISEQPKTVWDLKDGDECWTIICSELGYAPYRLKFNKLAAVLRETGSLYLTEEEAENDLAWNRARETLTQDAKGFTPSRSDDYEHIEVYYTDEGDLDTVVDSGLDGCIYFGSYADAEASIDAHPNEWRTYLGIKK